MKNLKIEYVAKQLLKPYAKNAKIHSEEQIEQIKKSIKQFGFNDPIAIWHDDEVIEGHGRLLAVMEMDEIETVPVIRLDALSDEQRRAYALVHNKLTMNSGYDYELMDLEIESIDDVVLDGYGLQGVADDMDDLDSFFNQKEEEKKEKDVVCPHCKRVIAL